MAQVAARLGQMLAAGSAARRENAEAVKSLEEQLAANGKEQVVEKVAYLKFGAALKKIPGLEGKEED